MSLEADYDMITLKGNLRYVCNICDMSWGNETWETCHGKRYLDHVIRMQTWDMIICKGELGHGMGKK